MRLTKENRVDAHAFRGFMPVMPVSSLLIEDGVSALAPLAAGTPNPVSCGCAAAAASGLGVGEGDRRPPGFGLITVRSESLGSANGSFSATSHCSRQTFRSFKYLNPAGSPKVPSSIPDSRQKHAPRYRPMWSFFPNTGYHRPIRNKPLLHDTESGVVRQEGGAR